MKRREAKGALSADLLVCFPSRTHLKLMPKPICSPARPSEPNCRHPHHHHQHQHQLVKKSSIGRSGLGHASPLMWAKTKSVGSEISEPTSPKVTCAGQIKVRHKSGSCKSWQSVMEEIERIHNNKKQRKQRRPNWAEAFGFKKEVMQFLTCLRSIRFDFRCFGSFPHESDITSDDDEDEEDEEENRDGQENHVGGVGISDGSDQSSSRTVFSKWFMVLQENQSNGFCKEDKKERNCAPNFVDGVGIGSTSEAPAAAVPPPNALLLMRCRSAPAKTWLEEKEEEEEEEEEDDDEDEEEDDDEDEEEDGDDEGGENRLEKEEKKAKVTLRSLMEEDKQKKKMENLVVMAYDSDLYNISSDIAKETWVVGGLKEAISRSRSWKI